VQRADGAVLASVATAGAGDDLTIRLADGRVLATTTAVEPDPALTEEELHG